uniref:Sugar phosphate transporter domain-containing protein n=1 Tax=Paramoeba aestuarina TaxID=180227 RepID=A0A7S4P602_9EUKA|mmetsp:Transcript_36852/g.57918  ORF Transcript_36852/g.57918 Transcript_36852/m.57918 type:complete len:312 (+) Transcript_36852:282-1217(+)
MTMGEKSEGSKYKRVMAVGYYMFCAILLTLSNKHLFHPRYGFGEPLLLAVSQLFCTLILLSTFHTFGWLSLPVLNKNDAIKVLPLSLTYIFMLYSGLVALGSTNLVMYNTLRRTGIFFVLGMQFVILGSKPSLEVIGSVCVLFLGTAIAATTDLSFSFFGYTWVFLCNFATALYIILIKHIKNESSLSAVDILYYNTIISFPIVCIGFLWIVDTNHLDLAHMPTEFFGCFIFSSLLGFFINHSIFVNTAENSPLTQAVAGQAKDILLLAASFFVDYVFEPRNFLGVLVGLFGSLIYAYVKYEESNTQASKE